MAHQNFRFKTVSCMAICLFVCLGWLTAYAEDPPVYVSQFGTLGSGNGQFNHPYDIVFDSSGNIWVADTNNHRIQEFTSSGTYISQFGSYGTGNGQFSYPNYIAFDSSGNIFVTDYGNNRIQKFTGSGSYLTQFGTFGSGNGQFNKPTGIAIDSSDNIFVVDYNNCRVQKFGNSGTYLSQFGTQGAGNGQLSYPWDITIDNSGNIFVVERKNHRIQKFSNSGIYISLFGSYGTGNGQFNEPLGMAIDNSGNIWVVDTENQRIQKFTSSGTYLSQFGTYGTDNGQLNHPIAMAIDNSDNIYVADGENNRIQKFAYSSSVKRTLPSCYAPGTKLTVTITATPASTTGSYAIEETPPAGWTVSNISNDGTLYSGVVKFGPFFDNTARTLTYDVTPPAAETGDKTFSGTASEDGVSKSIAGQTVISACPLYHPADVNKDFLISMDEMTAYGAAWKKGTPWSIAPNPIPVDYVIRAATLWKKGGKYKIDFTAGAYPLCWVSVSKRSARTSRDGESSAVRHLPDFYQADQAFEVSVEVTPASGVEAYGIEDQIPLGWTASGMNEGGSFDAAAFKVKFGPFITDQAKTLTYQVTPLADAKGAYTFDGTASFDGSSPKITGDTAVKDILPGDMNGDLKTDLTDAVISLQIVVATQPPPTAALGADVNSDRKIGLEEAVFALEKAAVTAESR